MPNVCKQFDVEYISLNIMVKHLNVRLVLEELL
ncbi:MAG: hypothetical protein LBT89_02220 [Planctomycetaceae bacterium]|nr:hypothetical protein [Planctomycetaceae bacterium]